MLDTHHFLLSCKMQVYVMVSGLSGWLAWHKNSNNAIFLHTIKVIIVKLCAMVWLIEQYLFIPFSVTLTIFQGYISVKQFYLKMLCSCLIKLKLCRIVNYVNMISNIPLFFGVCMCVCVYAHARTRMFKGDNWKEFLIWGKKLTLAFFSDIVEVRSSNFAQL